MATCNNCGDSACPVPRLTAPSAIVLLKCERAANARKRAQLDEARERLARVEAASEAIHRRYVREHAEVCVKESLGKDACYERGKAYGFSGADRLLHDALDGDVAALAAARKETP